MNNLNEVSGNFGKYYNQPTKEAGLINETLPLEIFVRVLSCLDKMEIKEANLVSRLWSEAAIDTAKRKEFAMIKGFAKFLGDHLHGDAYAEQRKALFNIGSDQKILNSVNLIDIKYSIDELKENFLNILKDIKGDELDLLEALSNKEFLPNFFENVFVLAKLYKQVDETKAMPESFRKWQMIQSICKTLASHGQIEKAIEVANGIKDNSFSKDAFMDISEILIHQNVKFGRAEQLANRITDQSSRGIFLRIISKELAERGDIDKAIEIADRVHDELRRDLGLRDICRVLIKNGNLDKALEVASMISDEFREQGLAFRDISRAFVQRGDGLRALECAIRISDESMRLTALKAIFDVSTSEVQSQSAHLDKFIEIAKIMPPHQEQGYVLQDLAEELVRIGDIDKSLMVANMISDKIQRDESLHYIFQIVKENSEKGSIEKGMEYLRKIFDY